METPPRRPGRVSKFTARLRKAERKKQILSHAKQLFVTLGYQHTTTEKLAQATGVCEPALYRHFPSKKAIFLEVLQEIRQATLHRWEDQVAGLATPIEKLHAVVDLYLSSTREIAVEFRIMHRALVETDDADVRACLRAFYMDSETFLAKIVGEAQEAGLFRKEMDPRVGAWEFICIALAYALTQPLKIPIYDDESYHEKAIMCLLGGMMAQEPAVSGP